MITILVALAFALIGTACLILACCSDVFVGWVVDVDSIVLELAFICLTCACFVGGWAFVIMGLLLSV